MAITIMAVLFKLICTKSLTCLKLKISPKTMLGNNQALFRGKNWRSAIAKCRAKSLVGMPAPTQRERSSPCSVSVHLPSAFPPSAFHLLVACRAHPANCRMRLSRSTTDFGAYLCATQYQTRLSPNKGEFPYDQERATLIQRVYPANKPAQIQSRILSVPGAVSLCSSHWCWRFASPGYSAGKTSPVEVRAERIARSVTIYRDSYGVPHICVAPSEIFIMADRRIRPMPEERSAAQVQASVTWTWPSYHCPAPKNG